MEQTATKKPKKDYSHIVVYDEDGTRITNRRTLAAIDAAQRWLKEWKERKEREEREWEEEFGDDDDYDDEEEI